MLGQMVASDKNIFLLFANLPFYNQNETIPNLYFNVYLLCCYGTIANRYRYTF